jgi:plastocyanin
VPSLRIAAPAALAFALLGVAPAQADQQIIAAPVNRFVNTEVALAPGERLTFASQDALAPHNVTSRDNGADGLPLFSSATIGGGDTAPVNGTDKLELGAYAFFCTIHPTTMNGTLTVRGDAVAADTTKPTVGARVDTGGLRALEQRKAILATLTSDESVTVDVTARAFGQTIARRTVSLAPGATAVALKLTTKGLRGIRKRSSVNLKLVLSAKDGSGNVGTTTGTRTLKRR